MLLLLKPHRSDMYTPIHVASDFEYLGRA